MFCLLQKSRQPLRATAGIHPYPIASLSAVPGTQALGQQFAEPHPADRVQAAHRFIEKQQGGATRQPQPTQVG